MFGLLRGLLNSVTSAVKSVSAAIKNTVKKRLGTLMAAMMFPIRFLFGRNTPGGGSSSSEEKKQKDPKDPEGQEITEPEADSEEPAISQESPAPAAQNTLADSDPHDDLVAGVNLTQEKLSAVRGARIDQSAANDLGRAASTVQLTLDGQLAAKTTTPTPAANVRQQPAAKTTLG